MIGEDFAGDALMVDAGARETEPSVGDLRLKVAMVPGEAVGFGRACRQRRAGGRRAGGEQEEAGSPNRMKVGVRFGSAVTMCRKLCSCWSASRAVTGISVPMIGSKAVSAATWCSSFRVTSAIWAGLPVT